MKKLVSLLLCIALALSLAACGPTGGNEDPKNTGSPNDPGTVKDTLTVAIANDPATMYPYYMLSGVGRSLYTPVYESLFIYGEDLTPQPVLVDTYTIDDDGLGITLKLKKGVLFHNGDEMKADDVLFSIRCLLNCNWAANLGDIDIDGCKAVDDSTVYLSYNSVQGPLLYMLCNVYVLSEAYMTSISEDDWTFNCIGTGPYQWGKFTPGSEYHMTRFDGYREPKALSEIIVRIIPESSVQAIELETGGIDMACNLTYSDISKHESDVADGYSVTVGPAIGSFAFMSSFASGVYQDERVRQAFAYGLDLAAVNEIAFSGLASVSTNIYAKGVPVWQDASNLHGYDPEKAKSLLTEAGYGDGITLDVYVLNNTQGTQAAEVIIASCARADITLNVTTCDSSSLMSHLMAGEPGFYLQTLYTNGDPYIMLSSFGGSLYSEVMGYSTDSQYATAVGKYQEALQFLDEQQRIEKYRELMDISYDRAYTVPMLDLSDIAVHPDGLKGYWIGGPVYHYEDCYWEA